MTSIKDQEIELKRARNLIASNLAPLIRGRNLAQVIDFVKMQSLIYFGEDSLESWDEGQWTEVELSLMGYAFLGLISAGFQSGDLRDHLSAHWLLGAIAQVETAQSRAFLHLWAKSGLLEVCPKQRQTVSVSEKMHLLFEQEREIRTKTQFTLGKLIDRLGELDQESEMEGICKPRSYRGYYRDLAFECGEKRKVSDVLTEVTACVGKTFWGYKQGEYVMERDTPIWIAGYGERGPRLMSLNDDGSIVTADEEDSQ